MAAADHGKEIWFFGGVGAGGTESILDVSNDLWCFDTDRFNWKQIPAKRPWPSPRRCVGWLEHGESLLLWGGSGLSQGLNSEVPYSFLNDLWRFSPSLGEWERLRDVNAYGVSSHDENGGELYPGPRYTPVFQSTGDSLFIFGGYTEDGLGKRKLNDTWVHGGKAWKKISQKGTVGYVKGANWPGVRYGCMQANDGRYVYICGGFSEDGDHIDLWRFDMRTFQWEILAGDGEEHAYPHPRYCAAFACWGNQLYLFGGRSRIKPKLNFNDLWVFDLTSRRWARVSENRAPHRYDSSAEFPGYHAKSATAVVEHCWYILGGEGLHGHVSDFWRFHFGLDKWELIQDARSDDPQFW